VIEPPLDVFGGPGAPEVYGELPDGNPVFLVHVPDAAQLVIVTVG
jgi:hypothetical protein